MSKDYWIVASDTHYIHVSFHLTPAEVADDTSLE